MWGFFLKTSLKYEYMVMLQQFINTWFNVRESFTMRVIIMMLKMFDFIRCSYYPF